MKFSRVISLSALVLAGAFAQTDQSVVAPRPPAVITLGTGFDYSRGGYGFDTDTEVFSVPLNVGYENGPWSFNAAFSHLTIKGPATIVGGSGATRPTAASESGLGDIYAGATYQFGQIVGPLDLAATARVKLPTADEDRGLGTGAADYYGELTFSRALENSTPFVTAGYRVLGDNATYQLRDGAYLSGGAHFRLSPASIITAVLNWRQPIVAGGDDSTDAMLMVTHDFDARWRLMAYGLAGFTDASPDVGAGLQLNCRF
ncbi:MAG: hypothetical protein HYV75_03175 [Opitutae bacterium]|nr:hypothetical protein [Opitutae bacterium]